MSFTSSVLALALLSAVTNLISAQTTYNSTTQICCNGTVSDKLDSKTVSCCGSSAIDVISTLCCTHDQVIDVPQGSAAISYGCCYDTATKTSSIFNHRKQECCGGKALDKPDPEAHYGCCSGQLYNATSHRCCGGQLSEQNDVVGCCGEQELYNSETHICCSRHGFDVNKVRGKLDYRVSERTSNTSACCGLKPFDFRSNVCCGDSLTPKTEDIDADSWGACCNGVPYDSANKLCCIKWGETASNTSGIIASALHGINRDTTTSCCGASLYDFSKEICCADDKVVPKPEGVSDQWMMCCGDQPITNFTTQVCVKNKLYEREDFNFLVCGDQLFDTRHQQCCSDQLFDNNSTLACCYGFQVYDKTTHTCCSNSVQPLTKEDVEVNHDVCCSVSSDSQTSAFTPIGV